MEDLRKEETPTARPCSPARQNRDQAVRWVLSMQVSPSSTRCCFWKGPQGNRVAQADSLFSVGVRMAQGAPLPQLLTGHLQALGVPHWRRLSAKRC